MVDAFFTNVQTEIVFQYSDIVKSYNHERIVGKDSNVIDLTEQDGSVIQISEILRRILIPFSYLVCIVLSSLVFYKAKLKEPLGLLSTATKKITANDLDFSLHYQKMDEMGTLCNGFEKMRDILDENNRSMWQQMEDRRRLNAAFSHDLRTPLTVLEGYIDILQKYENKLSVDEIEDTYLAINNQIKRLKNYVSSIAT